MSIMELGALGEFVGSILVLGTLIYLARQIMQGTRTLKVNENIALSQVHQARTDNRIALHLHQAEHANPAMASIHGGHPEKLEALSPEELVALRFQMMATIAIQDNILYQRSLGLLDVETLPITDMVIATNFEVWEQLDLPMTARVRERYESIRKS